MNIAKKQVEQAKGNNDEPSGFSVEDPRQLQSGGYGEEKAKVMKGEFRKSQKLSPRKKSFSIPADYKSLQKRTTSIFKFAPTEKTSLFEVSNVVVDPLKWSGTMGWR